MRCMRSLASCRLELDDLRGNHTVCDPEDGVVIPHTLLQDIAEWLYMYADLRDE